MHRIGVDEYKRRTDRKPFIKVIPGRFPGIIRLERTKTWAWDGRIQFQSRCLPATGITSCRYYQWTGRTVYVIPERFSGWMDRRSIKNGWSPVSAAAWIRGKNLMQCLPALPTRSSGLSSAIQQKPELPMIWAASLRTVRQVPIRESWRSFYIAGLRFSEKIREKDFWFSPVNWLTIMGGNWKNVYCSMSDNGSWEKNLSIGYRRKISSALRLLTGYPKKEASAICEELGYEDQLIDAGEVFAFWAIEGPQSIKEEFPFEKADLPILVTDNHKPYKQRKVRILSGAHACLLYRFLPRSYTDGRRTDWGQGRQFLYDQRRTDGSGILLCPQGWQCKRFCSCRMYEHCVLG